MAIEVKMPQLSDTMDAGKIIAWKKHVGDIITRGDILAEVETDKANLEIESFNKGVLLKITTDAGSMAKVGEVIAVIGEAGESGEIGKINATTTINTSVSSQVKKDLIIPEIVRNGVSQVPQITSSSRIKASPLARKVASQLNVDISDLTGTGPNGRIVRSDVEAAVGAGNADPSVATHSPALSNVGGGSSSASVPVSVAPVGSGTTQPFSKMRDTIARRMQESVRDIPHFYVATAVDMGAALDLRALLKEEADYKGLTVNHLIMKAVAYGLSKEPKVNRSVKNGEVFQPSDINVGIVTAVEDGLLIPVIKQTDKLSLKDLVFEARAAIERARAGRPNAQDLVGGTFSISNLGMFDVDIFTAIISPGQGGILAVSAIQEKAVVKHGQIVPGHIMNLTLSVDHRVIDGVMGATFLQHVKKALEVPAILLM